VIHRDVKTDNLFVEHDGRVKLLDFGLAIFTDGSVQGRVTQDGVFNGTPQYMPPEVFDGGAPSVAWDVYALATVAYELLTGTVPFHDTNAIVMLCTKRERSAPRLSDRVAVRFPAALERVLRRGLERDPARRHVSPIAFAEDFARAIGAGNGRTTEGPIGASFARTISAAGRATTGGSSARSPGLGYVLPSRWPPIVRAPLIVGVCCAALLATWMTAARSAGGEERAPEPVASGETENQLAAAPEPAPPREQVVPPEALAEREEAITQAEAERTATTPTRARHSTPRVTTVVFGARTAEDDAAAIVEAARWVRARWDAVHVNEPVVVPAPSNGSARVRQ
jgi:hypothetical protein